MCSIRWVRNVSLDDMGRDWRTPYRDSRGRSRTSTADSLGMNLGRIGLERFVGVVIGVRTS
jgi:hypothetical protein